jgi:ferredoxin
MSARTAARAREATGVKLHIDWTACDGRGLCMELLPELIESDDWGYPVLAQRGAPVPLDLIDAAQDAVAACPKRALKLLQR